MKIDNQSLNPSIGPTQSVRGGKETSGSDFAQVLNQAMDRPTSPAATGGALAPTCLGAGQPLNQGEMADQLSQLLDALEHYGQALGDPSANLRQVEPLAQRVASLASDLESQLQKSPDGDLSMLARQALAQAQAEQIKFHRGDYV